MLICSFYSNANALSLNFFITNYVQLYLQTKLEIMPNFYTSHSTPFASKFIDLSVNLLAQNLLVKIWWHWNLWSISDGPAFTTSTAFTNRSTWNWTLLCKWKNPKIIPESSNSNISRDNRPRSLQKNDRFVCNFRARFYQRFTSSFYASRCQFHKHFTRAFFLRYFGAKKI